MASHARVVSYRLSLSILPAILAGTLVWAAPLLAQVAPESERITVAGIVYDQSTEQPVSGVLVELEGTQHRVITDSAGVFVFRNVPRTTHNFVFRKMGYVDGEVLFSPNPNEPIFVPMTPQPLILEGLAVRVNRLDERVKASPYSVRVFDQEYIFNNSAIDAWTMIQDAGGFYQTSCETPDQVPFSSGPLFAELDAQLTDEGIDLFGHLWTRDTIVSNQPEWVNALESLQRRYQDNFSDVCIWWRGRPIRPIVCIDDRPVGGVDVLIGYPADLMYRFEVFRSGQMIRVYTEWFIERVAEGRRILTPTVDPNFC